MRKFKEILKKNHVVVVIIFIAIFVVAYFLHLFGVIESFKQFVVVLTSAAATYVIVSITLSYQTEQQQKLQQKLLEKQNELQKGLLENQSKEDNKAKRDLELYNAKLKVYSDFVSSLYESLSDNQITEEEFIDLRTKLLGNVCFYIDNKEILGSIKKELEIIKSYTDTDKMASFFAGITSILQKDLKKDIETKEDILLISRKFDEISDNTPKEGKEQNQNANSNEKMNDIVEQTEPILEISKRLKEQAWHFNAWDIEQFDQFNEPFDELKEKEIELSLVEYGEYWRTNLLKQVEKGDIIMLFRRGGSGYVGAFKAIGRRIFDFEKGEEEILYFNNPEKSGIVTTKDDKKQFDTDANNHDFYGVRGDDGVTLCSNLIVKCLAYVPDGVGNPGGVYRRTISRYDSHYAWLLKERFQKKGQWLEQ